MATTPHWNPMTTSGPNTTTEPPHNEALDLSCEIFVAYIAPVFYIQGIVGNIFAIVVFLKSKTIRQREVVDFLLPLACADLGFLIFGALVNYLHLDMPHAPGGARFQTHILSSPGSCKILSYLGWLAICVSNWIVALLSWERALVMRANQTPLWLSRKKRIIALTVVTVLSSLLLIPILVQYNIDDDGKFIECGYDPGDKQLISYLGEPLLNCWIYVLPLIAVWIANSILTVHLCKKKPPTDEPEEIHRRAEERKLVRQLIGIPIMFLVFTTPPIIFVIINDVIQYQIDIEGRTDLDKIYNTPDMTSIYDFLSRFLYLNNCLDWIVYIGWLDWFRQEARVVCGCPEVKNRSDSEMVEPLVSSIAADDTDPLSVFDDHPDPVIT